MESVPYGNGRGFRPQSRTWRTERRKSAQRTRKSAPRDQWLWQVIKKTIPVARCRQVLKWGRYSKRITGPVVQDAPGCPSCLGTAHGAAPPKCWRPDRAVYGIVGQIQCTSSSLNLGYMIRYRKYPKLSGSKEIARCADIPISYLNRCCVYVNVNVCRPKTKI